MLNKSKTYCVLPWINAHIEANGRIRPCGVVSDDAWAGSLENNGLPEVLNSELYKQMRRDMINGKEHPACKGCYYLESFKHKTLRISSNEKYENHIQDFIKNTAIDGSLDRPQLLSLEIRFSNLCNFKCRTCNETSSSSWYQDINSILNEKKFIDVQRPTDPESMWGLLDRIIPELRDIYILGGEPVLEPNHYVFLDKLLAANKSDVNLRYSTNMSYLKLGSKSAIEYWKKFPNLTLSLSYDGIESRGEFIRKGMDWEKTVLNHRKLQAADINFIITPTVSVLNAFHIPDFLEYLIQNNMISSGEQIGVNILNSPSYFNIGIFNEVERIELENLYNAFITNKLVKMKISYKELLQSQLELILEYIKKSPLKNSHERKKFLVFNSRLNKLRKDDFLGKFPELKDFYLSILAES